MAFRGYGSRNRTYFYLIELNIFSVHIGTWYFFDFRGFWFRKKCDRIINKSVNVNFLDFSSFHRKKGKSKQSGLCCFADKSKQQLKFSCSPGKEMSKFDPFWTKSNLIVSSSTYNITIRRASHFDFSNTLATWRSLFSHFFGYFWLRN